MNLARGQRGVADNLSTVINSGRELDVHIGGRVTKSLRSTIVEVCQAR